MKKKHIVPYDGELLTIDTIGKEDEGKTLAFRNQVHNCCQKKFDSFFKTFLNMCAISEKGELEQQKNDLYVNFFLKVNERIFQIITPATEDITDDYKRGKKRLEMQERIDVETLVNETPLILSPLLKNILRKNQDRSTQMSGKKVSKEREELYSIIHNELNAEGKKPKSKRRRKSTIINNLCNSNPLFKNENPTKLRKAYDRIESKK
ncbi:MAG: hypothetical protein C0417_08575 [Chlorobiaceae bacterium]|nr:hypothetical protein [Chlorobiaceae bacterium]